MTVRSAQVPMRVPQVVHPRVVGLRAAEERVVVQGQVRPVEAAVGAHRLDVLVQAGAADEHAVAGHRRSCGEPRGGHVLPVGGAVAVRLVHRLEVDQRVGAVLGHDGVPHRVEGGGVGDPATGGGPAVVPERQDDLHAAGGRRVDDAGVGIPPRRTDRSGVDRQPDGVRAEVALEAGEDGVRLGANGGVAVAAAQPVEDKRFSGEVVAGAGPVDAPELVRRGRRVRCRGTAGSPPARSRGRPAPR